MGKLSQNVIIDQINEKIDPQQLIEKINYAPEKVQIIGTTLKCFCPIHKEKAFRSLIIDLKKKTFRCSMKGCKGFEGGSLVEFYALHTDQSELKAAFSLAKLLDLPIDADSIRNMSDNFLEEARQAFQERQIEKAQNLASQSIDVWSDNHEARFFLAQAMEELGNNVGAVKEFQCAADGFAASENYARAIEIYEQHLLQKEPRNENFLRKTATLYEQTGAPDRAIQFYQTIVSENESRDRPDKNIEYLTLILNLNPALNEARLKLAQLYESQNSLPAAVEQFMFLANALIEKKEYSSALPHLTHLKDIVPENFDARQKLAEIYERLGDHNKAEQEYLELGESAIEIDELETAENFYRVLIEKYPKSIAGRDGLIALYEKTQNRTAVSRECSILAEMLETAGENDRAAAVLARAKEVNPKNVNIRDKIRQILIKAGRLDEAIEEIFCLADLYHEAGDESNVAKSLDEIKTLKPDDLSTRSRAIQKYIEYDNQQKARDLFSDFINQLTDDENYEGALQVCDKALECENQHVPFHEQRLNILTQLGRTAEAIEGYRSLAAAFKQKGELEKALEALGEALSLDEKNIEIHQSLVEVYLAQENNAGALSTLVSLNQIFFDTGDVQNGIDTAEKILQLSPEAAATRERLADLYRQTNVFDRAIEEYNKTADYYINAKQPTSAIRNLKAILEIDETNIETLHRLADLLLTSESFEAAKPYLMKGLETLKSGAGSPDEIIAEYRRILKLKEEQVELKEEFAEYLKGIERNAEAAQVIRDLADTYVLEDNHAKAAGWLEELLIYHPQDNKLKAELADMYLALDITQEAVNYYAQAALGFRESGDEKDAINLYKKIIGIEPQEESIREELAILLSSHGETKEAIEHNLFLSQKRTAEGREAENLHIYQRLLELEPSLRDVREKLAALYHEIGENAAASENYITLADAYEKDGDTQSAIIRSLQAKELIPEDEEIYKRLIRLYEKSGDKDSLKSEHISLGDLYLTKSDPDSAEVHYRKAQKLDPTDIGMGEQIAKLNEARQNYSKACEEYRKVAKLYEQIGDVERAIGSLRRVKALEPDDFECRENIARMLAQIQEIPDALREYYDLAVLGFDKKSAERASNYLKQIAALAPDNSEMRMASAQLLFSKKKKQDGMKELLDLSDALLKAKRFDAVPQVVALGLEKDEKNWTLREARIKAYFGMNQTAEAIEEYRQAADLASSDKDYTRAESYLDAILETNAEDTQALHKAVECARNLQKADRAIYFLGSLLKIYEKAQDWKKAIEVASQILAQEPEDVEMMKTLSRLHLNAGEESEAVALFDRIAAYFSKHGNFAEACNYLSRILEYDTDSIPTVRKLAYLIYENENLAKARPHFKKLLDLCRAVCKPEEMVSEFENIIKIDQQNPSLRLDYARYLREQNILEKAKKHFLMAARLLEDDARTRAEAISIYEELLDIDTDDAALLGKIAALCAEEKRPDAAYAYYLRCADAYLEYEQKEEAIQNLISAIAIKPEEATLLSRIADLYVQTDQIKDAIEKYLELSELNIKQNKTPENINVYQKILELAPADKAVRLKLAKLFEKQNKKDDAILQYLLLGHQYEDEKDPNQALATYKIIRKIDFQEEESRNRIIEIYLATNRVDDARKEMRELADIALKNKALDKAESCLIRIKNLDPNDVSIAEELAHLYESKGDLDTASSEFLRVADIYLAKDNAGKAIQILLHVKDMLPDNFSVREKLFELYQQTSQKDELYFEGMDLSSLYFDAGKEGEAIRICQSIADFEPSNAETRLKIAAVFVECSLNNQALEQYQIVSNQYLKAGKFEETLRVADEALKLAPDQSAFIHIKIEAHLGKGDQQSAVELLLTLAELYKAKGDAAAQEDAFRKAIEIQPGYIPAHEGLIRLLTNSGQVDKAINELLILSAIHKTAKNAAGAIACHQEILIIQPENVDVRDGLAALYKEEGNLSGAVAEYFTIAGLYEQDGNIDTARSYFEEILSIDETNVEALHAIIRIARKQKDTETFIAFSQRLADHFESIQAFADAVPLYQGIIQVKDSHLPSYQKMAACLEGMGNIDEALDIYKTLAAQYQKQGAFKAAIQQLEIVERHRSDDVETLQMLAQLHLKVGAPDRVIHYFTQAIEILQLLEKLDAAMDLAKQMIRVRPERPESHLLLATLQETAADASAAKTYSHAAALLEKDEKTQEAVNARAAALRLAPELVEEREKYAAGLKILGRNSEAQEQFLRLAEEYTEKKNFEKAAAWAEQALNVDPANSEAHRKLKLIYTATGNAAKALQEIIWLAQYFIKKTLYQDADNLLREGIELDAGNIALREILVALYQKTGQADKATEQLLKITELALFNGDLPKAIASLECAKGLASDNAEIRKTLAGLYKRNNQTEKAQDEICSVMNLYLEQGLIEEAHQLSESLIEDDPKDCAMRLRIADIFISHGIPELASRQYLEISSLKKVEGRYEEVLSFADKCLSLNARNLEARENRVEALMKLNRREDAYREFMQISDLYMEFGLLEKARDAYSEMGRLAPEDPLPLQKLVNVFALINNKDEQVATMRHLADLFIRKEQPEEAIETFKSILDVRPDDTRARMKYIDLYAGIGSELELIGDYLKLIEVFSKRGAQSEAARLFDKLITIAPNDPDIKEKYIQFLIQNKNEERAFSEMLALAAIYEDNAQFKKAINILGQASRIVPNNPEVHLQLAETYVLMNAKGMAVQEFGKTADLYEKAGNEEKAIEIHKKILDIDPQNLDAFKNLIERLKALGRSKNAVTYETKLADLYIERGLLDLAENIYRDILVEDPENIEIWNFLIQTHLQIGLEEDLVDDYIALGDLYQSKGALKDAISQYRKVIETSPNNVEARRKYIDAYLQIGLENDLVNDYLDLADVLVQKDEVDEALRIYSHVMSLDPENQKAFNKLSETKSRYKKMESAKKEETAPEKKTHPVSKGAKEKAPKPATSASQTSSQDAIDNYKNILSVNPSNANARCKLAEIYLQLGRVDDAVAEWDKASETFIFKGELDKGINLCEKILERKPADAKVRERLSKAILQKDYFKAIDSAISSYSDVYEKTPGTSTTGT